MVNIYATEDEQVEHIKKLWREYGIAALVGVLIALIVGFGWRNWQDRREHTLEHASMRYEQLVTNAVNGNSDVVENIAMRLIGRYPETPYAEFAALQLARQDVYQGKLDDAVERLTWAMQHGTTPALREVARIRLARILLAQNKPAQALDLVKSIDDKDYVAAAFEAKGDALLALGKAGDARLAYQDALNAFPGFEAIRPLLQMKFEDLTGASNAGAQG